MGSKCSSPRANDPIPSAEPEDVNPKLLASENNNNNINNNSSASISSTSTSSNGIRPRRKSFATSSDRDNLLRPRRLSSADYSTVPPPRAFLVNSDTPVFRSRDVGGKGHNLLRLNRAGAKSPPFMVISASECADLFTKVAPDFGDRFAMWLRDPVRHTMDPFCDTLMTSSLSPEVIHTLDMFLAQQSGSGVSFAVRSSFNDRDTADSVFAGVFETYLNVRTREELVAKILECFASCFKPEAVTFYTRSRVRLPAMAVVVMVQLRSEVSGVLFQANPVTGARNTAVISASYGQGDGVNGGIVIADEFWVDSRTLEVRKRIIQNKSEMVTLVESGGTTMASVPEEKQNVASLSDEMVKIVVKTGHQIAEMYDRPQDVEFAFVGSDLFILQTRPIKTMSRLLQWEPPDTSRTWHLYSLTSSPMTPIYASVWAHAWSEGLMYNSHLMGNIIKSTEACVLNGFGYFSLEMALDATRPPLANRMAMRVLMRREMAEAAAFWKKKRYATFLSEWDKTIKQQVVRRHKALAAKKPAQLSDVNLLQYFDECYRNLVYMFNRHVIDVMQSMAPMAWFVLWVRSHAPTIDEKDAYVALEGHSPVAEGLHGEFPEVFSALASDPMHASFLSICERLLDSPDKVLEALCQLPSGVGSKFANMVSIVEYRLVQGYDTVNPTLKEKPLTFVSIIKSEVAKTRELLSTQREVSQPVVSRLQSKEGEAAAQRIRAALAVGMHEEFDELLAEARNMGRLRDERALYTDLTAAGILHHCLMEIGNRLFAKRTAMDSRILVLYASYDEICTLLSEKAGDVTRSIINELKVRRNDRRMMSVRDAPGVIGGVPSDEPTKPKKDAAVERVNIANGLMAVQIPSDHFASEYVARSHVCTQMVLTQFVGRNVEESNDQRVLSVDDNTIRGIGGSSGVHRGKVLLLNGLEDFEAAEKGTVVVTRSASSLVNLVLPFAGAIVTDYGALLSHSAVCAREAGIPCVLGCKIASEMLRNGMLVEVDGTRGVVRVLSDQMSLVDVRRRNRRTLPAVEE